MPGESPSIFGDALRRLSTSATYLYQDSARYWYSTQPTVTKMADDRAEQLKRDPIPDVVVHEIDKRLRLDLKRAGDFSRVHALPQSGQDVPDDTDARLVVLSIDHPYSKEPDSPGEVAAKAIFESRGTAPRLYRNTLTFLAADKARLQDLLEAVRRFLAWESILFEREALNLTTQQIKQAETQRVAAEGAITSRIPETYQWLLVPVQSSPQAHTDWQATRLSGQEPLALRASKKLRGDELLVTGFAPTRLKMELDRVPLWRGDHVEIRQLVDDFARYLYLPRLRDSNVLIEAIRDGLGLLLWTQDSFAYADSFDEAVDRYRGLRCGQHVNVSRDNLTGLLVRPERAVKQQEADAAAAAAATPGGTTTSGGPATVVPPGSGTTGPTATVAAKPKRYHGTVVLDPARVGRDASRVADEVISHLAGLVGAKVKVTLEVEAQMPNGASEQVVRTVTENGRTLKFTNHGFEID
jgi:hypothetical protein